MEKKTSPEPPLLYTRARPNLQIAVLDIKFATACSKMAQTASAQHLPRGAERVSALFCARALPPRRHQRCPKRAVPGFWPSSVRREAEMDRCGGGGDDGGMIRCDVGECRLRPVTSSSARPPFLSRVFSSLFLPSAGLSVVAGPRVRGRRISCAAGLMKCFTTGAWGSAL